MNTRRRVILLSLLLSAILSSMIALTATAFADSKQVTFDEPVTVGNVVLKPGTYHVVWDESGAGVQVSFVRGGKTVATVPARLIPEKSPFRTIETTTLPDNSRALKRLTFRSKTLDFDQSSQPDKL